LLTELVVSSLPVLLLLSASTSRRNGNFDIILDYLIKLISSDSLTVYVKTLMGLSKELYGNCYFLQDRHELFMRLINSDWLCYIQKPSFSSDWQNALGLQIYLNLSIGCHRSRIVVGGRCYQIVNWNSDVTSISVLRTVCFELRSRGLNEWLLCGASTQ
jgi:hypothetical protein